MQRRRFLQACAVWATSQTGGAQPPVTACNLRLRFGVAQFDRCDPLAEIEKLAAWGFDYVEPAVVNVMALSTPQFESALAKASSARIHVEAMNMLLPADLKVVGPHIDRPRLRDYLQKALARAEALGAKVIVFGSGYARMVPEEFSKARAWMQLQEFLRMVDDEIVHNKYGMVIGIEALRRAESNIVNRSAEAYALAVQTRHPKIRIVVDFFHLATEKEDPAILKKAKDYVVHVHFSDPTRGRKFPRRGLVYPEYLSFFSYLREIGYQRCLSIEGYTDDFQTDAPAGLAAVRALYADACAR
jgi:D-psicose/D-tagatose/L-ribulose 3-epimerase